MDEVADRADGQALVAAGPADHVVHGGRPSDLRTFQVPVPHAAMAALQGGVEVVLHLQQRAGGLATIAVLAQVGGHEDEDGGGDGRQGHEAEPGLTAPARMDGGRVAHHDEPDRLAGGKGGERTGRREHRGITDGERRHAIGSDGGERPRFRRDVRSVRMEREGVPASRHEHVEVRRGAVRGNRIRRGGGTGLGQEIAGQLRIGVHVFQTGQVEQAGGGRSGGEAQFLPGRSLKRVGAVGHHLQPRPHHTGQQDDDEDGEGVAQPGVEWPTLWEAIA